MQIGIFTVGDVTPDPTTGRTPSEHERIKATVAIAKKAEEIGLDVFATGEHHNPPFIASAPTTTSERFLTFGRRESRTRTSRLKTCASSSCFGSKRWVSAGLGS